MNYSRPKEKLLILTQIKKNLKFLNSTKPAAKSFDVILIFSFYKYVSISYVFIKREIFKIFQFF